MKLNLQTNAVKIQRWFKFQFATFLHEKLTTSALRLTHDVTAGYQFMHYLPQKSITIGDKGYVSSKLEAFLKRFDIVLSPIARNNMQQENKEEYFTKRRIRKGVETAFSMITAKFGKVIKATTIGGFLTKEPLANSIPTK